MAGVRDDGVTTTGPAALVPMALLLCALSYATVAQGAFYPSGFRVFVLLVGGALGASLVLTPSRSWVLAVARDPLVATVTALAVVTVASAAVAGAPSHAIGTVSLLVTMAAAVAVVKALPAEPRRLLVAGIVVIAVVVAAIGWAAVVARWQPDALMSQGLWRAASTLTYENALAAFLTVPALFCLDRLMTAPAPQRAVSEAAYVVVVGIGASLSRGGVLGLLIGIGVLGAWRGPRSLVRLGPPLTGALVSLACLAPSLPVHSSTHVGLACAGFVAGGGAAAWTPGSRRWHRSKRWRIGAGAAAAAVVGALVAVVSTAHVAGAIARARLSASGDRAHEWSAAWAVARAHLVLGVGAARVPLQWEQSGHVATATFAHNEFLQLLVQDGVVGLAVLLVGLTWVVVRLARVRGRAAAWSAECAVSCLVALLVQGALDFVWHIPVIPVLMAVMLALATTTEPGSRLGAAAAPVRAVVAPGPRR